MKYSIIILLFISIACQGQLVNKTYNPYEPIRFNYTPEFQEKDNSNIWVLGVFVFSISCDAIGDGLHDDGKKVAGKMVNAAGFTSLLALPFIKKFDKRQVFSYFIGYGCIRAGGFDLIYNGTRGLPVNYIGNTSLWDQTLQEFEPSGGLLFVRAVFLTAGVSITLRL